MVSPPKEEEKVKDRQQLLWEKVQCQNKLLKLEAGHIEQIAKFELQVAQQQTMLQDVRSKLEVVNDEICALWAPVADPSVPTGPLPERPPLPAPRTPPPDLLDIFHATPVAEDQVMASGETEDEFEWKPVRRLASWNRRNTGGDFKGFSKQQKERQLSVPRHQSCGRGRTVPQSCQAGYGEGR